MTSRNEVESLAIRMRSTFGREIHHEHDAEGRLVRLWAWGVSRTPLEFAEWARRMLAA